MNTPYKPMPILSAALIADAQKELGKGSDFSRAVQLCGERYANSPETKAEERDFASQEARRRRADARASNWQAEEDGKRFREWEEAEMNRQPEKRDPCEWEDPC